MLPEVKYVSLETETGKVLCQLFNFISFGRFEILLSTYNIQMICFVCIASQFVSSSWYLFDVNVHDTYETATVIYVRAILECFTACLQVALLCSVP